MAKAKVLLIGWDAADWKTIRPLLNAGRMPNLARLMGGGVHGNLATIYPVLSPMLWTSIATGKRANKHGIHGFSEPSPGGSGVRPISILSRKTKALWNILNQTGHRSIVVGWWPSHPAEPLNGVMVSNHFSQPLGEKDGAPSPPLAGTIYPPALAKSLAELRFEPMELTGEFIRPFVPDYDKIDQKKDKRLHSLGRIIAETMSVHAVATELLETQAWDFAGIYYCGLDHFQHGFMRYHPPRLPSVSERDFELYQHVIANAYRYHDAMLGALLRYADEQTTVVLLSDHGFHPDHLRPGYIPAEPTGPAVEHRHFGIICMKGPALRVNETLYGASLLDVCPTVLSVFGLPAGKDMDGKILVNAFSQAPALEPIESWDSMAGEAGLHPAGTQLDTVASAEAFKQLVALGYVAPPAADMQETIDECVRELKYNLARSYRDGNRCAEAAALLEELWSRWPQEHRFGILLAECLAVLRQVARRGEVLDELGGRIERFQKESAAELAKREQEAKAAKDEENSGNRRAQFEERRLRELALGRPLLLDWLRVSQALMENRKEEARSLLKKLTASAVPSPALSQHIAGAVAQLGDMEGARELLEVALKMDPENALVHGQLALVHFEAGRHDDAIAAATESLSLIYFQPGLHALLGQALLEKQRYADAEQELRVALAQNPRTLSAHEALARLYRDHLNRPAEAFAHEGRAASLKNEIGLRKKKDGEARQQVETEVRPERENRSEVSEQFDEPQLSSLTSPSTNDIPPPFGEKIRREEIITVVSGLPRSGTSMTMQILAAAGRQPLTDSNRPPDEDNPLGYFEFQKTPNLAKDASWLPEARGKVIKIVAQLLPSLPAHEYYEIIFMERELSEIVASQAAMLARQGRRGASITPEKLLETYRAQVQFILAQMKRRNKLRVLSVRYADLLAEPRAGIRRIAEFLGAPFNSEAAARAVRPELRRQKA